jgi:hypothetical protein
MLPIGQQEIQHQLQGYDRSGFSHKGGSRGRPIGDDAGMARYLGMITPETWLLTHL